MGKRILIRFATLFFALIVLTLSVVETSSIKYDVGAKSPEPTATSRPVHVVYALPFPGNVYPGSPLWPMKVLRDKVNLELTSGSVSQSDVELHLADKRLAAGWEMWKSEDTEGAFAMFAKAEGYLETSFETLKSQNFEEGSDILRQITFASLKHREILEKVLAECSDEARPMVTKFLNPSKDVYEKASKKMVELGFDAPINPF